MEPRSYWSNIFLHNNNNVSMKTEPPQIHVCCTGNPACGSDGVLLIWLHNCTLLSLTLLSLLQDEVLTVVHELFNSILHNLCTVLWAAADK